MMKLKHLFENYELARQAIKNWDFDEDTLDNAITKFRISSNAVYPFFQKQKRCFIRIAPIDEKKEKNIYGEMEFISYLINRGFPALKPIKAKNGDDIVKIFTKWGSYYVTAFEHVNGVQIEDTDYSDEIMFEYGKTLGKLHQLSAEYIPSVKKWSHIEVLEWIKNVLCEYKAKDFILSKLKDITHLLSKLTISNENYGLIHYDFELDNVFYDKNTDTCSVNDFDDGMYHWYIADIEQVFDSFENELSGNQIDNARRVFIQGYKTRWYYNDELNNLLPLMRRFINLFNYSRLIRCVDEKLTYEPEWMMQLREKLDKSICSLESKIKNEK